MAGDEFDNGKWQREVSGTLGHIEAQTESIQRELSEFKGWTACEITEVKKKMDYHTISHTSASRRLIYFITGSAVTIVLSGASMAIALTR